MTRRMQYKPLVTKLLGGIVIKKSVYQKMTPEHRAVLNDVTPGYMQRLKEIIRKDNSDALAVMAKQGIQTLTPQKEHVLEFRQVSNS